MSEWQCSNCTAFNAVIQNKEMFCSYCGHERRIKPEKRLREKIEEVLNNRNLYRDKFGHEFRICAAYSCETFDEVLCFSGLRAGSRPALSLSQVKVLRDTLSDVISVVDKNRRL